MIRYGVWHGGSSYFTSHDWTDSLEKFDSLDRVHLALLYRNNGGDSFTYMKEQNDGFVIDEEKSGYFRTPATDESQFIDLFDLESGEPYERLSLGPRLGLVREGF